MAELHMTVKSATKDGATLAAKASEVVVPDGWAKDADAIHRDHGIKSAELSLVFEDGHPLVKGQVVTVELSVAAPADAEPEPEDVPEPGPEPDPNPASFPSE